MTKCVKMRLPLNWERNNVTAWSPCNIYESVIFGRDINIGAFTEIGPNVKIGSRVRIGFGCFIPEGVTIGDNAFIGPRVTFTNDRFPPSPKEDWEKTIIQKGARIGAGVTIVCGVTIGENALVGAGSTVTRDIPDNETWAGCPAIRLKNAAENALPPTQGGNDNATV